MLQYFRINDPYRLLGLFVLFTLLCLPLFIDPPQITLPELKSFMVGEKVDDGFTMYSEIIDNTAPAAAWFYGVVNWFFGRSLLANHLIAFLILFFQCAFLGTVLIEKKAFPENTYIPSFIFLSLTFISYDFFFLSADLVAFGFTLLALNNLFKEIEFRAQRNETMFNLGIYISAATLLNFSFIVYLPGIILILIIFTRNSFRNYLLLSFGFVLPHLILGCYYFLKGSAGALWKYFYLSGFQFSSENFITFRSLLLLGAVPIFYLVVSFFILNRNARPTKYQSQLSQAMFLWFLVSLTQVLLSPAFRPQSLLVLIPSVSFFFTHFFLLIRRRKLAGMNAWILLIGIISVFYLARYGKLSRVDYSKLIVAEPTSLLKGKRILSLQDDMTLYLNNKAAPPCINPQLTLEIFKEPDYYENVLLVNMLFEKDQPEMIIDPQKLMKGFFERIPTLQKKYEETPEGYTRKKN